MSALTRYCYVAAVALAIWHDDRYPVDSTQAVIAFSIVLGLLLIGWHYDRRREVRR